MTKKTKNYFFAGIFIIFLFHLFCNIIILEQDNVVFYFDEGSFYNISVDYYKHLFSVPKISEVFRRFHSISNFYPPLAYIARMPFYAIWGASQDVSALANLFFLFILIYFVFLIGDYIKGPETGILAAFLISFYPAVYGFSRTNFVTIPMASSVALSLYLLLRCDNFISRKFSILFGISVGLGLLIKWLQIIYIFPPAFLCLFISLKKRKEINFIQSIGNMLISVIICLLIVSVWYLPNIKNIFSIMFSASYDNPNWVIFVNYLQRNPFRVNLLKYLAILEQYQLYTFFTALFLYSFFKYLRAKNDNIKSFLIISFAIPYIVFNFSVVDYYSGDVCPRYIVPLLIQAAIITAIGVTEIKKNIIKQALVVCIVVFGLSQFFWTWIFYSKTNTEFYTEEDFERRTTRGLLSPKKLDWQLQEIINTIRDNRVLNRINVMIIPHTPLTSALAFKLETTRQADVVFPLSATFIGGQYSALDPDKFSGELNKTDFVLTQEGGKLTYDDTAWIERNIRELLTQFEKQKNNFLLFREFIVGMEGKGVKLLLYRRNIPGMKSESVFEPFGEGIKIYAADFYKGNLVYNSDFGMLIDGGISPAYAIYEFYLPKDGRYEIWIRHATQEIRPVEIYFDGFIRKSAGLTQFTEGWSYVNSRWFRQVDIVAEKGRHSLGLLSKDKPFPHIDCIQFMYKEK